VPAQPLRTHGFGYVIGDTFNRMVMLRIVGLSLLASSDHLASIADPDLAFRVQRQFRDHDSPAETISDKMNSPSRSCRAIATPDVNLRRRQIASVFNSHTSQTLHNFVLEADLLAERQRNRRRRPLVDISTVPHMAAKAIRSYHRQTRVMLSVIDS
jgi:hypothetical protein